VTIPPLRDRKEDIYALCRAFLERTKRPDLELGIPYLTGLFHYDFPYNVRELEALIKRGVALVEGDVLGPEHLSEEVHACMKGYGARATGAAPASADPAPWWPARAAAAGPFAVADEPTSGSAGGGVPSSPPRVLGRMALLPSELELRAALARHRGNVAAVGRDFGKERVQVHRWMKRYAIDPNEYR
jgi:DNA-binding NtrC family response regulator